MKGDVGMLHHEKEGNKKMPIPRQEIIDNPIPTSLFSIKIICTHLQVFLFVLKLHPPVPTHNRTAAYHINKDVGMGLSMISCLGIGIFLFPSFS